MKYTLKMKVEDNEFLFHYGSKEEAHKALKEKVVKPGREYISKLPPSEIRTKPKTPRSRKIEKYVETFYSENSLDGYYFLYDRQDPENPRLVLSGIVIEEGKQSK